MGDVLFEIVSFLKQLDQKAVTILEEIQAVKESFTAASPKAPKVKKVKADKLEGASAVE